MINPVDRYVNMLSLLFEAMQVELADLAEGFS
jgi:hypothetical protein